jgi:hypothetical protein
MVNTSVYAILSSSNPNPVIVVAISKKSSGDTAFRRSRYAQGKSIGTRVGGSHWPTIRKSRSSTALSSMSRASSQVSPCVAARLRYSPTAPFDIPVDAEICLWVRWLSKCKRRTSRILRIG